MAHFTVRKRQTKAGLRWTVTQAAWQPGQDKVKEQVVTETALRDIGFTINMTPEEASEHAHKLNALDKLKRKEQKSKVKASERLHDLALVETSIVPDEMSELFVVHIEENWYGGPYNLRKQIFHWRLVRTMLTKLNIQPHEYFKRKNDFYRYFERKQMGKSYVEKVLKVLNQWGEFYAEQTKTFFKKVPNPRGVILERIKASAKRATGKGSASLTPAILKYMQHRLPQEKWNYVHATLWFGFRPSELNAILLNPDANLRLEDQDGTKIVGIYQGKLTSVPDENRWRYVPCISPEQDSALASILAGRLDRVTVKTMRKHAPAGSGNLGTYSGRKGFTDLFLEMGQSLEDISQWMGHTTIERTWRHYKNKKKIHFKPLFKVGG